MDIKQRGLDQSQEQFGAAILRDTRSFDQRVTDFLKESQNLTFLIIMLAATGFLYPPLVEITFLFGVILYIIAKCRRYTLPFRMPKRTGLLDYNTPKPGSGDPSIADGTYFFGNDLKTNDELWFNSSDVRTHALIFGSTGSGKTEALVSIAFNALIQSSGFIYVDGKGDNALFAKVFSMVRSMGREDDLLLINFMTGARDIVGPQEKRLSNTMNPFCRGSSSMLSNLVVGLMDAGKEGGGGDMWKGRAISFVEALIKVLVAARDAGLILLDANSIRNYFELPKVEEIADRILPRPGQEPASLADLPDVVLQPLENYLASLPGYVKEKKGKQGSGTLEQHGYIVMQLTRLFSSLADTYSHIIRTNLPEVDLKDVVINRRILVVLLPALEKSTEELSQLGKIIIASLKTMMASGLGEDVEGKYSKVVESKPTTARSPYLCILDEYGYYAVPGFAVVPAQARSLGFSVIFAGQDLPAFQKGGKEEAASIGANTNIKICMKLEDPTDTWEFFQKSAGESYVAHVSGFQADANSVTGQYADSKSTQMEKRSRIDLLDLKEQKEGEYHIFFKSRIVRGRSFYANPKPVKELRLNQFIKIAEPTDTFLANLINSFENFAQVLKSETKVFSNIGELADDASSIAKLFADQFEDMPLEKGIAALMAYHDNALGVTSEFEDDFMLSESKIDVFIGILNKTITKKQISIIDGILAKSRRSALNAAVELIKDMHLATTYPFEVSTRNTETVQLAGIINEWADSVKIASA